MTMNNVHFSLFDFLNKLTWSDNAFDGRNGFWAPELRISPIKKRNHHWGYIEIIHPTIKDHRIHFRASCANDKNKFHSEIISLKSLVMNHCPIEIAEMTDLIGNPYNYKTVIQKFRRVDKNLKFTILPNLNILIERDTSSEAIIRQL